MRVIFYFDKCQGDGCWWTCFCDVLVCYYNVSVWELMFYLLPRVFGIFVKGNVNWIDVTNYVELLVYVSVFVMNRRALFFAIRMWLGKFRRWVGLFGIVMWGLGWWLFCIVWVCCVGLDLKISSVSKDAVHPLIYF